MEDGLRLNLYSFMNLKNEPNTNKNLQIYDRVFFVFDRFPAISELIILRQVKYLVLFD